MNHREDHSCSSSSSDQNQGTSSAGRDDDDDDEADIEPKYICMYCKKIGSKSI